MKCSFEVNWVDVEAEWTATRRNIRCCCQHWAWDTTAHLGGCDEQNIISYTMQKHILKKKTTQEFLRLLWWDGHRCICHCGLIVNGHAENTSSSLLVTRSEKSNHQAPFPTTWLEEWLCASMEIDTLVLHIKAVQQIKISMVISWKKCLDCCSPCARFQISSRQWSSLRCFHPLLLYKYATK